ncbi:MAG TPA: hypothetical protein VFG04_02045 [Planctomycetaceae bacterium]|nr:hypothetical protein [Planctomycetaceae bacterium]
MLLSAAHLATAAEAALSHNRWKVISDRAYCYCDVFAGASLGFFRILFENTIIDQNVTLAL